MDLISGWKEGEKKERKRLAEISLSSSLFSLPIRMFHCIKIGVLNIVYYF